VSEEHVDTFVPPLLGFNPPDRYYYKFGRPIFTSPEMVDDDQKCDELYAQVRLAVWLSAPILLLCVF
jgi:hypothetical protein